MVVLLNSRYIGKGNEELGDLLMKGFLGTLVQQDELPEKIIFYHDSVYLTLENSSAFEHLKALKDAGVDLLCCGTCLNFFNIDEKKILGRKSNMDEIVKTLESADKIIRP